MASEVFDLAVVGAGVLGLAHAYMATKRGKRFDFVRGTVHFAFQCADYPATIH